MSQLVCLNLLYCAIIITRFLYTQLSNYHILNIYTKRKLYAYARVQARTCSLSLSLLPSSLTHTHAQRSPDKFLQYASSFQRNSSKFIRGL